MVLLGTPPRLVGRCLGTSQERYLGTFQERSFGTFVGSFEGPFEGSSVTSRICVIGTVRGIVQGTLQSVVPGTFQKTVPGTFPGTVPPTVGGYRAKPYSNLNIVVPLLRYIYLSVSPLHLSLTPDDDMSVDPYGRGMASTTSSS